MSEYYYLAASMKPFNLDDEKIPSWEVAREEIVMALSPADLDAFETLLLPGDNENLLSLLEKKNQWNPKSVFKKELLEERVAGITNLPDYMMDFLMNYRGKQQRFYPDLSWQDELHLCFLKYVSSFENEFLDWYFVFDADLRNIAAAYNSRKYQLNIEKNILSHNLVAEKIKTSAATDFGLSSEWPWFSEFWQILGSGEIFDREKKILEFKIRQIDRQLELDDFTLDYVLGYFTKLLLLTRIKELSLERGQKNFTEITRRLSALDKAHA